MAYEPLHHKYRPKTFADLVGQGAIAQTLTNAIVQNRLAPAYLFSGPRGTGKTSSARILAKSLNCQAADKPTPQPCGRCEACRSIAAGFALDVIEIDAASNTGVDNIRELIEKAQFAPVQCRYKVYVIDECHMLSTAAFNALLKTLEEPPDRVVFVLATTDPQRVLPTIISRCQRFDYRRIPLEEMVAHLRYIADQELIDIDDAALRLVGQLSQGGLRDSESLLDQLSLLPPPVAIEAVWDLVGAVPERDLLNLLGAIAANNPEALLDQARQLMNRGREPLVVLQNLASFYRDLLIAKTAPQRNDLVAITPDTWSQMTAFAQGLEVVAILRGQQHLRASEVQIKNTTQPRLWLEVTLMGLLPGALAEGSGASPGTGAIAAPPVAPAISSPAPPDNRATAIVAPSGTPPAPPLPPPAVQAALQAAALQLAPGGQAQAIAASSSPASPIPAVPPPSAPVVASTSSPPLSPSPEPLGLPAPAAASAVEPESPLDLEELWKRVGNQVEYRSTQMLLRQQCRLVQLRGAKAEVAVTQQWLNSIQGKQGAIEAAFTQVLGRSVSLKLNPVAQKPDASTPNRRSTPAPVQPSSPAAPSLPTPTSPAAASPPPPAARRPPNRCSSADPFSACGSPPGLAPCRCSPGGSRSGG